MKKIHVLIVSYNGMQWLPKTLASVPIQHSILIVDNNSQDDTVNFVKKNYPEIELIVSEENLGFGKANNIGISKALKNGTDYVLLLNQDAYLKADTVEQLIKVASEKPEYGILSPIHLDGSGTRFDRNFTNYVHYDKNKDFLSDALFKRLAGIYDVPFINAACWLLPRKTLKSIGGFDPIFFHYGEDDNYCQRILFHGMKIGVVSDCYVRHDRENRVSDYHKNTAYKAWLKSEELRYKINSANINYTPDLDKPIRVQKNVLLRDFVFFRFRKINKRLEYLKNLKTWRDEIKISRNKNKTLNDHYL